MPLNLEVTSDFDFKGLIFFIKTWRKGAFGQLATSEGSLMQIFPEIGIGSLENIYNALSIQHPIGSFGNFLGAEVGKERVLIA
ncbi:hypothetical protein F0562_007005 [Nyssa sinensis]|uniref:Uncharacterized protein n=1 Tax=Nyssa sinensis TaxID=561372 RepID=A0A5J5A6T1_9ASTE|nr:hypothetical protein F0562_007005 [Nyssa sinensis]